MRIRILNMLGLAQKAGKMKSGGFSVEQAVKSREAKLVILAEDTAEGSRKQINDKARYRHIPVLIWGNKEELGKAIGRTERSSLALTDENMAGRIVEMIEEERNREQEGV